MHVGSSRRGSLHVTMALANAAAAAPIADEPQLYVVGDAYEGMVYDIVIALMSDGTPGLSISSDDEDRPVVVVGRDGVLAGDVILAIDGTELSSHAQVMQELRQIAQTGSGAGDEMTVKVLRPPMMVQPVQWSTAALTVAAGERRSVPLVAQEPSLGTYTFACASRIDTDRLMINSTALDPVVGFELEFEDLEYKARFLAAANVEAAAKAAEAADVPYSQPSSLHPIRFPLARGLTASRGHGSFHVPRGGVVTVHLDNTASSLFDVTLQATVSLTPVSQLLAAEALAMHTALSSQAAHVRMLAAHESGLATQEMELEAKLEAMRMSRAAAAELLAADEQTYVELEAVAEGLAAAAALAEAAAAFGPAAAGDTSLEVEPSSALQQEASASARHASRGEAGAAGPVVAATDGPEAEAAVPQVSSELQSGLASASAEAEEALATSKATRAAALEGRRHIRERLREHEEQMRRAQVINLRLD